MGGGKEGELCNKREVRVQRDVQEREVETSPVRTQFDFSLQLEMHNITVSNSTFDEHPHQHVYAHV